MRQLLPLLSIVALGCASERSAEDPSKWAGYEGSDDYDVEEPLEFTDVPYGFTGDTPIRDIPVSDYRETWFAPDDAPPSDLCDWWRVSNELPVEVEGIVTIHPRYYFKTSGCLPPEDAAIDSDEKYYGSYFIEDDSGGFFVLGDSKVAHFDMGARVKLKVRSTKEAFGLEMITVHDVLEVDRGPHPIHYEELARPLDSDDAGKVRRMTGTVGLTGGFGEVQLCLGEVQEGDFENVFEGDDQRDAKIRCIVDGRGFYAIVDAELQRRGIEFEIGEQVTLTGPALYSFNEYRLVLMRVGQISTPGAATE